jgi:competence ComEA-like helix-hairpin-helix protein
MSPFTPITATPEIQAPDPTKHVNFSQGMVLGVDDFNQEFAYLSDRTQWLARDLLGYGTVCGLEVSPITEGSLAPGVRVDPGVALNPRGQFIKVDTAQCAALTDWLNMESIKADIVDNHRISDDKVTLYVVLCYRDCLTDNVPIPGEPCRAETGMEDSLLKPSRIQDDYRLEFTFQPPDQTEEDYLRDFVGWLRQVSVTETGSSLDDFAAAIREAIDPEGFMRTPIPPDITIPRAGQREYLRLAFRIWTTEVRPLRRGTDADCVTPTLEDCIQLAKLEVPLSGDAATGWTVDGSGVVLDQNQSPYLLHLRFMQEWLLGGGSEEGVPEEPTRILAASWPHNGNTLLDITVDGTPHKGLIIAFGKRSLGDDGLAQVEPGSLDFETFQVFAELPSSDSGVDFWAMQRIRPDAILPVKTGDAGPDGLITEAGQVTGPAAGAAALLLSSAAFSFIQHKKLVVVIKGDHVMNETGEHAIQACPIGRARPGGEGGTFESWTWIGLLVNVNLAAATELQALPGVGARIAGRIVSYRTANGPFTSIDGLLAVSGIGPELLNGIRPFITLEA